MDETAKRHFLIAVLKTTRIVSESIFLVTSVAILSAMAVTLSSERLIAPIMGIAIGCILFVSSIYCIHSLSIEHGTGRFLKGFIPPIVCGLLIFAIGWPNLSGGAYPGKIPAIPFLILLAESSSPIICYVCKRFGG